MVCAMHRMFQSSADDEIMEGNFDPEVEKKKRAEEALAELRRKNRKPGLFTRLFELLPIKA